MKITMHKKPNQGEEINFLSLIWWIGNLRRRQLWKRSNSWNS